MSQSYDAYVAPGSRRGTWEWEIRRPDGTPHIWGAKVCNKKEITAHMKKLTGRLNTAYSPEAISNFNKQAKAGKVNFVESAR